MSGWVEAEVAQPTDNKGWQEADVLGSAPKSNFFPTSSQINFSQHPIAKPIAAVGDLLQSGDRALFSTPEHPMSNPNAGLISWLGDKGFLPKNLVDKVMKKEGEIENATTSDVKALQDEQDQLSNKIRFNYANNTPNTTEDAARLFEINQKLQAIKQNQDPVSRAVRTVFNPATFVQTVNNPVSNLLSFLDYGKAVKATNTVAKTPENMAIKASSSLTDIEPEALKMQVENPQIIKDAAARLYGSKNAAGAVSGGNQTGNNLRNTILSYRDNKNAAQNFPEIAIINKELDGKIGSVQPAIDALEKYKAENIPNITGELSGSQKADISEINKDIKFLKGKNKDAPFNPFTAPSKPFNTTALMKGTPEMDKISISNAPDKFSSDGLLYTKMESPYNNQIVYKAPDNTKLTFNGNESVYIDKNQAEALKSAKMWERGKALQQPENPNKYSYPGDKLWKLNQFLDDNIDYKTRLPLSDNVQKARLSARRALRDEMTRITGGEDEAFDAAMNSYSEKKDLLNELHKRFLNGSSDAGEAANAGQKLINLFRDDPNAIENQKLMQQFEQMTGKSFIKPAYEEHLASQFGKKGEPALLPQHRGKMLTAMGLESGAALLAGATHHPALAIPLAIADAVTAAAASPKIATRAIIPAAKLIGSGVMGGKYIMPYAIPSTLALHRYNHARGRLSGDNQ